MKPNHGQKIECIYLFSFGNLCFGGSKVVMKCEGMFISRNGVVSSSSYLYFYPFKAMDVLYTFVTIDWNVVI